MWHTCLFFLCFVCRHCFADILLYDRPACANSDVVYFHSKSVFCFAFRLEWHSLMMPVLLLFRMGKLGQIGCTFQCCFWCFFLLFILKYPLYPVSRFLPPAYSISNRMIAQTPMSPYISPIPTYQVWMFYYSFKWHNPIFETFYYCHCANHSSMWSNSRCCNWVVF